jgi:hypothetical protein
MKSVIADSSVASTNLLNALQHINREQQRVSENTEAVKRFETCKHLRRQILRYVSLDTIIPSPSISHYADSACRVRTVARRSHSRQ